jgi:hypothetical protein
MAAWLLLSLEEKRGEALRANIDKIDTILNVAAGNGMFQNQSDVTYDDIQGCLHSSRLALDCKQISEGEKQLSLAISKYGEAMNKTRKSWRFVNVYGGPIWVYLIAFLVGLAFFYIYDYDNLIQQKTQFDLVAINSVSWGLVGSILRGLWYLKKNVDERLYRKAWRIYFLSTPFLGAIFGGMIYLIVLGGLLGISQQTDAVKNSLLFLPLAAVAGFNWNWAIEVLTRIPEALTKSDSKSKT